MQKRKAPTAEKGKSKLTSAYARMNFKFPGFCLGKNGNGVYICVHSELLGKVKKKLTLLTKSNRGRHARAVMKETKAFIRGWLGYFHIADTKRTMQRRNG